MWQPTGVESTREEKKKERTRSVEDMWDDIEDALPALRVVLLRYRKGGRAGRYRAWKSQYLVTDENRDAGTIVDDITGQAEEIEDRHGQCTFQTTCQVEVNGRIESYPPVVWELYANEIRSEVQNEAIQLIRQQSRILRHQGNAMSRQMQDVERASGAVVRMVEAVSRQEQQSVEAIRARNEHDRWKAEQQAAEHRADEELGLIKELGPKALAVMAAKEAREAATARSGGEKKALWKHAIEIAKQIRGRPEVQDILGERGTEIMDELGDARTKEQVEGCFDGIRKLATLKPTDPGWINVWNLVAVAPEVSEILDVIVRG